MAAERVAQICGPLWGGEVLHNYYLVFLFPAIFLILSISLMLSSWSWMDDSKFKKGNFRIILEFLHEIYAKSIVLNLSDSFVKFEYSYSEVDTICHFSTLKWSFCLSTMKNPNFSGSDAPRLISS